MNKDSAMIEFNRIHKVFAGNTHALAGVSASVAAGEFCVLLGSSGAGKTTLLKMVNGLVSLSEGHVSVNGWTLNRKNLKNIRSQVAMIHQSFAIVPRLTVEANVLSGAAAQLPLWRILSGLYPVDLRRKAAELCQAVGLDEAQFNRRATSLSGGQQQRVGIARAFITEPEVVLADEPVASLDPKISYDILQTLRTAARQRNATVVCSLHQLDLAREFADRIIGMGNGSVVYDGPPDQLDDAAIERIYGKVGATNDLEKTKNHEPIN